VLKALLGEPRYLAIAPDAVRIDLEAPHTSPAVRALLHAAARDSTDGTAAALPPPTEASILTVLSTFHAPTFTPLTPMHGANIGSGLKGDAAASRFPGMLTSFPEGLAHFAARPLRQIHVPGAAEHRLRQAEGALAAQAAHAAREVLASGPSQPSTQPAAAASAVMTEAWRPCLAALWDAQAVRRYAAAAGFGTGGYGDELQRLVSETAPCAPPPCALPSCAPPAALAATLTASGGSASGSA